MQVDDDLIGLQNVLQHCTGLNFIGFRVACNTLPRHLGRNDCLGCSTAAWGSQGAINKGAAAMAGAVPCFCALQAVWLGYLGSWTPAGAPY